MQQRITHPIITPAHPNDDPYDTWIGIRDDPRNHHRLARVLDQQKALQDFCDAYDNDRFVTAYARFRG